jgi:hypothetical protein
MIAYNIQHHGNKLDHLQWLTKALAEHAAVVDVCLDSPQEPINTFSTYCTANSLDNVRVFKSMPVIWAGPSVVNQMRDMLRLALEKNDWEWLINLSGSCAPVVHPKQIYSILKAHSLTTQKKNFCHGYQPKQPNFWLKSNGIDGYFLCNQWRTSLYMDHAAHREFELGNLNPLMKSPQRRGIYCSEQLVSHNKKSLLIRGLYPSEWADRIAFYKQTKFFIGRQWVILHRSAVEWLCTAPKVAHIYNFLNQTFCPDESFFQTCLAEAPQPIREATDFSWNFRHRYGAPGKPTANELLYPNKQGALFARKIGNNDNDLRSFIESQLWLDV